MAKLVFTINTKKGKEFDVQKELLKIAKEVHPLYGEWDFVILIEGREEEAKGIAIGLKKIKNVTSVNQLEVKDILND